VRSDGLSPGRPGMTGGPGLRPRSKYSVTKPNGKCEVCRHVERIRIELLLAGGASQKAVASKFDLKYYAVHRHWNKGHVSDERKAALIAGPAQRMALSAQVSEESASVIDHYRAIRAGLYSLFNAALEAGDRNGGALLGGKLKELCDSIARLTGQLAGSSLVTNNTLIVMQSPQVQTFLQDLAEQLAPYPEALHAVIGWLEQREAQTLEAINGHAVLEHQP
jgi:hypothetical protein